MMSTADILRRAKDHISDPKMWHKGGYFADGLYEARVLGEVPIPDDIPCCALGACWWSSRRLASDAEALLQQAKPSGIWNVADYNDAETTTHDDIMALFDRAIARAEEQEAAA